LAEDSRLFIDRLTLATLALRLPILHQRTGSGDRDGGLRHEPEMEPDPDQRALDDRLAILDVLVAAVERRSEVFAVVESSEDPEDAVRRLQDLLGVSEVGAIEVLNMQWRRLTRRDRTEIHERRDELRVQRGPRQP
jgi:hypothetical protein